MHAQERVALRAKIAVDAGTTFEKYTYLTNDLLQPLTTRIECPKNENNEK